MFLAPQELYRVATQQHADRVADAERIRRARRSSRPRLRLRRRPRPSPNPEVG